jgi:hypothetical protein
VELQLLERVADDEASRDDRGPDEETEDDQDGTAAAAADVAQRDP